MKTRNLSLALFSALLTAAGTAGAGGPGPIADSSPTATSQIILKLASYEGSASQIGISDAQLALLESAAGKKLMRLRNMSGDARVVALPEAMSQDDVSAIAARIADLPGVSYAVADRLMTTAAIAIPNDPMVMDQWHYYERTAGINLQAAWPQTMGDPSVRVAVIDTGILGTHEDLATQWTGGYDFISQASNARDGDGRDPDPTDEGDWYFLYGPSSWHGSHVAGTIAAATNNGLGGVGIAPDSVVVPVRVLGKLGGYTSDIVDAIRWSAGLPVPGVPNNPKPAKVLNLSLGGTGACDNVYQSAFDDVAAVGAVTVVAAGNSSDDAAGYSPASCDNIVTVGSVDRTGGPAWYSNYGPTVEISAPGGDTSVAENGVLSTVDIGEKEAQGDAYAYYQGTSMAAPHVAGVVALMFSVNPGLTPQEVLEVLQWSAKRFPAGTPCASDPDLCGAGILDAGKAVRAAMSLSAN